MASKLCPFCMKLTEEETCPHCGNNINYAGSPAHLPAGYVVSGKHPYVLGAALGQGGFGITYIALDMVNGQRVAIKEYFPTHCSGRTGGNTVTAYSHQEDVFQKGKDRFLDEAKTLKSLSDLKNIVNVLDYFEANNTAYLVMEFLEGSSLKAYAAKNGRFPAQQFLKQLKPLMEDLHRMHDRGVIHRDIAPDNIILLPDGRMKLIDFGAARSYLGDKSMTVMVKKGFAPVEQYLSSGSSPCTDVYALAATIYYCITGTVPADSALRQSEDRPLAAPTSLGADITPDQEKALLKAMELRQKERTQSVQIFLEQLSPRQQTVNKTESVRKSTGNGSTGICLNRGSSNSADSCGSGKQKPFLSYLPSKKEHGDGNNMSVLFKFFFSIPVILLLIFLIYSVSPKTFGKQEIPTGMHNVDGVTYYYQDGQMYTGWLELSGDLYYFHEDGSMATGECTIGYEICTFGTDGKLIQKIRTLKTPEIPASRESSEEVAYYRNNGSTGYGKYQILEQPIENCVQLTVTVRIADLKSGNIDSWGLYLRDPDGNWTRAGEFTVSEDNAGYLYSHQGSQTISFNDPVTFDAYVCFCESLGSSWNFSFVQKLSMIKVVESYGSER